MSALVHDARVRLFDGYSHVVDCWGPRTGADLRFAKGVATDSRMRLRGGELLGLAGFMPRGEVVLRLPEPPKRMRLFARGRELDVEVALHTLLIEPDERRLTLLWAARARTGELPLACERDLASYVTAQLEGDVISPRLEASR